jgi:hypothetical protein
MTGARSGYVIDPDLFSDIGQADHGVDERRIDRARERELKHSNSPQYRIMMMRATEKSRKH